MHVGIDLLFLVPGETGGRETYARELLGALRRVRPDLRLTAFLNRETAAAGSGFWSEQVDRAVVLPHASGRARARWAAGELVGVARAAARAEVDVLHGAGNFAPAHGPFARVLTLHDLLYRELPELMPAPLRWATAALVAPAARRATRVVTGSEASRTAIVQHLGVAPERVVTTPYGLGSLPAPGDGERARAALGLDGRRRLALGVATNLPHKNLALLLDALAALAPAERPVLALAGHGTDGGALPQRARELGLEGDVRLLGGIPSAQLEDLYAAAALLVTVTRYEGFGLPVLEAMARGVPVLCSDIPVLREVAGEQAVFVDNADPRSVADGLRRLLADGGEVERLRAAGRERAARFTWEATAEATAAVYEAAAAEARR